MQPALKSGQFVIFTHSRNFKVGDVVLAFQNGREVVKRIADYKNGQAFLVGDNKQHSTDSRVHGWLVDRHIHGKLLFPRLKNKETYKSLRSRK